MHIPDHAVCQLFRHRRNDALGQHPSTQPHSAARQVPAGAFKSRQDKLAGNSLQWNQLQAAVVALAGQ